METKTKPSSMVVNSEFQIISFFDNPSGTHSSKVTFRPHSLKRLVDNEIFTVGDRVSNGTAMCGKILEFSLLEGTMFVTTDYSGVGMNVSSLIKVPILPCRFQIGETVKCAFKTLSIPQAVVRQVHFIAGKIKYDLEVWLDVGTSTRIYNIDESILEN